MKSDAQPKKDVDAELEWEPSINAAEVGVAVKDGVVTLSGQLDTFVEKYEVEKVVQRVAGVRVVAFEIEVKLPADSARSDTEIVHSVETAFKWQLGASRVHSGEGREGLGHAVRRSRLGASTRGRGQSGADRWSV